MIHPTAVVNEVPFDRRVLRGELPDMALQLRDAVIDDSAYVGPFVVVYQGIERPTEICARAMVEAGAIIGHDALIEEDAEIASNAGVSGYAIIRKGAKIGVGAKILPYICVGENATVGAGAVVTKHIPPGETWAGVPAERLAPRSSSVNRNNGFYRCGCGEDGVWDGCPHHGTAPVC